ncbi:MAG: FtsX-like permease family protein, partial [Phycisphaerae bacterium]
GGFSFAGTLDATPAERDNPWTLLNRRFDDGAVPVIGDQAAVLWQMHLGLGKDLATTDGRGRPIKLRFVALLTGSALQGEIVMAESRFVELFPATNGYQFFLIEAPTDALTAVEQTLEQELARFGFDVVHTRSRLADLLAVQNTYLSTFQLLGGLGLILGTVGLAAVLLRNVWERRAELALMRAVGFAASALGWMVLAENAALVLAGLICGVLPALLAIAPAIAANPGQVPWALLGMTLCGVLLAGMLAGFAALVPSLRSPLLPALRSE